MINTIRGYTTRTDEQLNQGIYYLQVQIIDNEICKWYFQTKIRQTMYLFINAIQRRKNNATMLSST